MGMNLGGFLLGLASLLEAGKGFILGEWDWFWRGGTSRRCYTVGITNPEVSGLRWVSLVPYAIILPGLLVLLVTRPDCSSCSSAVTSGLHCASLVPYTVLFCQVHLCIHSDKPSSHRLLFSSDKPWGFWFMINIFSPLYCVILPDSLMYSYS